MSQNRDMGHPILVARCGAPGRFGVAFFAGRTGRHKTHVKCTHGGFRHSHVPSSYIDPGPQLRGTGGTLIVVWKGHRDRGHPPALHDGESASRRTRKLHRRFFLNAFRGKRKENILEITPTGNPTRSPSQVRVAIIMKTAMENKKRKNMPKTNRPILCTSEAFGSPFHINSSTERPERIKSGTKIPLWRSSTSSLICLKSFFSAIGSPK